MSLSVATRYLDHLTDADLAVLARFDAGASSTSAPADGPGAESPAARLRRQPHLVEGALSDPSTYDHVFAAEQHERVSAISPFLVFALLVHRSVADLHGTAFVAEPFAGHRRIPVFDAVVLREHFADPVRRLLAAEHLASYTRVVSGPVWIHSPNGKTRKVRYSELDPVRLAHLSTLVADTERPGIHRRLGDLALFLTGVFADHASRQPAHPIAVERLLRSVGQMGDGATTTGAGRAAPGGSIGADDIEALSGSRGMDGLLRVLGPQWYRLAARSSPVGSTRALLSDAAEHFDLTRRFLVLLTDRYLFPLRDRWFGPPA
ncbi:MAG: hypothetical protein OEY23_13385 [Acidimicrobiia bacterium]|nr:hypothetical protein [Acidimicrobiia bacterium]